MAKSDPCTLGKHPVDMHCGCGGYASQQCCSIGGFLTEYGPCRQHKCGPRVGCRCPLPVSSAANGQEKQS